MAWSWSHSQEAYIAARYNMEQLDRETLEIIFAEWRAAQGKGGAIKSHWFDRRKYNRALKHAATLPGDVLVDFIWEHAENASTCDNGGFHLWMCPHGCRCHCVPCDYPEGMEQRDIENYWAS